MFRLISVLLLLVGLGLLALAGNAYLSDRNAAPAEMSAPPPAEEARSGPRDLTAPSEAGRPETRGFGITSEEERFSTASTPQSDVLQRLRTVPIAHETPTSASFNRSFEVTVAIDATGDDTAADALPGEGNVVEGEAQVLDKAQATLSGSAFEIDLISPSVQTVSPVTENVWRWKVRPTRTGMHELRIELFALDGADALPIRTFTDRVEVKVSRLGQVIAAADQFDPVFMVLGGLGSLLAGLFGVLRFFRR